MRSRVFRAGDTSAAHIIIICYNLSLVYEQCKSSIFKERTDDAVLNNHQHIMRIILYRHCEYILGIHVLYGKL